MEKKLDFSAAWDDVVAMLKANMGLVLPIAGVFIILPAIVMNVMLPQPDLGALQDPTTAFSAFMAYFSSIALWIIISGLIAMVGYLAIYHFVLGGKNPTVGEAISLGLGSFLTFFLATLISGIASSLGAFLLLIPGIYLAVKFSLVGPAIVAEGINSPIEALSRSWALTKGNSLRIFGFFLIVGIVGYVAALIAGMILGGILGFILPVLATIVSAILNGIVGILMIFVGMAVYRQLK